MKIFVILLLSLRSFLAMAEIDIKKVILPNKRVITITGHPDYPPVIWADKHTKQLKGIAVELLQTILSEANIKAEFINVETWGRAQEEVKAGRIDILLPPYKNDERLTQYNYAADQFMMDETVVFVKKGNEFKFETFKDLLKYPGAAIINDSFGSAFDEFDKSNKNITRLPTTEQCFRFVDKDRARYVIAGINSGLAAITKLGWQKKYTYLPKRVVVTGMYSPISMKSPWNTPEMNSYLKKKFTEYAQSNRIKLLEKKYLQIFLQEIRKSPPPPL